MDVSKEHLKRIGKRIEMIRLEMGMNQNQMQEKYNLPGATMSRLETGKGVQIFNLLKLVNALDKENYNIKWIFKFDNSDEFKTNEDTLTVFTFNKKDFIDQTKKVKEEMDKLQDLADSFLG